MCIEISKNLNQTFQAKISSNLHDICRWIWFILLVISLFAKYQAILLLVGYHTQRSLDTIWGIKYLKKGRAYGRDIKARRPSFQGLSEEAITRMTWSHYYASKEYCSINKR